MSPILKSGLTLAFVLGAGALTGGCIESRMHLTPTSGSAFRQQVAAQVTYPDAQYEGDPAPGADGRRVGLAQDRYGRNAVIKPAATTASTVGDGGGSTSP